MSKLFITSMSCNDASRTSQASWRPTAQKQLAVLLSLLGLLADDGLQRLSGLECGYYLGGNLDLLPRLWIHPRRCLARSSLKLAESGDDNGLVLRERLGYEINHSLDRLAGIFFGKPRFLGQLFDELCFVHAVPPRVDSNGQHSI